MDRLDKQFRQLTKAVFSRYGFAYAEVLSQWPAIVGEDLGKASVPERIRWPRASDGARRGGTIILRVAIGRALEFQHLVPHIIERVNGFYGYEAVTSVKILQGGVPEPPRAAPQGLPEVADEAVGDSVAAIKDEALRLALLRLGTAVSHRGAAASENYTPTRIVS